MLNYIERNKEWIFSGIGIAIIVAIYKLISSLVLKKARPKPLKEPQHIAEHTIRQTTSPARGLTVESIIDQIQSAPPYQKEAIAKNFEGIHVKWKGKIWDIGKPLFDEPGGNDVVVQVHPGESIRQIRFTVSVDKYPELKVLNAGIRLGYREQSMHAVDRVCTLNSMLPKSLSQNNAPAESPNRAMQPTAGRSDASLYLMKTRALEATLAPASGG